MGGSHRSVTLALSKATDRTPSSDPLSLKYTLVVTWCSMQICFWMTISQRRGCFEVEGTAVPGVVSILFVVVGEGR